MAGRTERTDALQHAFDECSVRLGFELAGLQDHGAVALLETPARHAYHVVLAQMIPFDERVSATDAAVITVLRTLVAELDQAAQGNDLADVTAFELVGSGEKFGGVLQRQQGDDLPVREVVWPERGFKKIIQYSFPEECPITLSS